MRFMPTAPTLQMTPSVNRTGTLPTLALADTVNEQVEGSFDEQMKKSKTKPTHFSLDQEFILAELSAEDS